MTKADFCILKKPILFATIITIILVIIDGIFDDKIMFAVIGTSFIILTVLFIFKNNAYYGYLFIKLPNLYSEEIKSQSETIKDEILQLKPIAIICLNILAILSYISCYFCKSGSQISLNVSVCFYIYILIFTIVINIIYTKLTRIIKNIRYFERISFFIGIVSVIIFMVAINK